MNRIYLLPLITFLIGMIITIIGALFKIQHWTGASFILMTGMSLEVIGLILLIIALIKNAKTK